MPQSVHEFVDETKLGETSIPPTKAFMTPREFDTPDVLFTSLTTIGESSAFKARAGQSGE